MDQRRPLIAGNWKMFKTWQEARDTAVRLAGLVAAAAGRDIMVAPQFTALVPVCQALAGSNIGVGAQDLFWEAEGAYTGEVSPSMVAAAGCRYAIIGHSERRQYFGETDDTVNRKIRAARSAGLIPVMCIGETGEEREAKKTFSVLDKQIQNGLKGFDLDDMRDLVVAYEPVWAIGTGKTATSEQAQEVHAYVRSAIRNMFGAPLASALRILYGGSVKPNNIGELMNMADIDGALVGGASLDADTFAKIVNY
ncbi:MAG: triose-phosphate isomerase [Thermodesulfobacteriota bacterium]